MSKPAVVPKSAEPLSQCRLGSALEDEQRLLLQQYLSELDQRAAALAGRQDEHVSK